MKNLVFNSIISSLSALILFTSCDKGSRIENQLPETNTSVSSINLTGENRLNSLVNLKWWGTDPDGFVEGFEFSFDQQTWYYTTQQDSTFLFAINAGSDTIDIDFWVRSIDDQGDVDDSPAYLKVPLKNTPPEVEFNTELIAEDTAFSIIGLAWGTYDLDGLNTIQDVQIKLNDGDWTSISTNQSFATIIPDNPKNTGATSSKIWYDLTTQGPAIEGLLLGQANNIYIKAIDIAGSESNIDTVANVVITSQVSDVLMINANSASPNQFYHSNMQSAGVDYDFIDFVRADAKNMPKVWNPVFAQLLNLYDAVVMYSNDADFTNVQSNAEDIIIEFAATSFEQYVNNGGKLWLSTSFPNDFSSDSPLNGILPMDSLSSADGQARLPIDSLVVPTTDFPTLTCKSFISGLDPFYPSTDATVIYNAQLTKNNGWEGPSSVGAKRLNGSGNANMVLISIELHKLDKDQAAMQDLFDKVLNQEFNW